MSDIDTPPPTKKKVVLECTDCQVTFNRRSAQFKHDRKFHQHKYKEYLASKSAACRKICALCKAQYPRISELQNHLQDEHQIKLMWIKETFYCDDDFHEWKSMIQKESKSQYTIRNTYKKKRKSYGNNLTIAHSYFVCNRSGVYNLKKNRVRQPKLSGSIKCGFTCPAMMNVTKQCYFEACEITVEFQCVHVGHELDVNKLRLPKEARSALASSLSCGVPIAKVLEQTKSQFSASIGRQATRRDVHNVCRDFKIGKFILQEDDVLSVETLVQEMTSHTQNSVLLYKPIGHEILGLSEVEKSDFLLGIMNETQVRLLEMYGNIIIVDSSKTHQYNLHLTTIMVSDVNHEVLPISLLFSSRCIKETFIAFLSAIKNCVPNLKADVIITEDSTNFIDAWEIVFAHKPRHLLCSWNVIKDWNINAAAKVRNNTTREDIKALLKELIFELNSHIFERKIMHFIASFREKEPTFIKYFTESYQQNTKKWAYCYRVGLGFNTEVKLQRWHPQFKLEGVRGKIIECLGILISMIMKNVAKRLLCHLTSVEWGIVESRALLVAERHNESLEMENEYSIKEIDQKFVVTKNLEKDILKYSVEKINKKCQCHIKCDDCNICIHTASCTCVDFTTAFVICKHIHFVCQRTTTEFPVKNKKKLTSNQSVKATEPEIAPQLTHEVVSETVPLPSDNYLVIDISNINPKQILEKEVVPTDLRNTLQYAENFNKVQNSISELQTRLQSVHSPSTLQYVFDNLSNLNGYLDQEVSSASFSEYQENVTGPEMKSKETLKTVNKRNYWNSFENAEYLLR